MTNLCKCFILIYTFFYSGYIVSVSASVHPHFSINVLWVSLPTHFSDVERKRRDTIKCFCFLLQFPQHYRSIKPLTWQQWVLYAKGLFQDICCVWLLFSDFWHFWPWQMNIMLSIHLFLAILQWACLSGSFFAGIYDLMSHETIKICKYR